MKFLEIYRTVMAIADDVILFATSFDTIYDTLGKVLRSQNTFFLEVKKYWFFYIKLWKNHI